MIKCKKICLSANERDDFITILNRTSDILDAAQILEQKKTVDELIDCLKKKEDDAFIKKLSSVDMWGGSGAVWEVYIDEKTLANEFTKEMLILIDHMEKTGLYIKRIKTIKKFLKLTF